MEEMPKESCNLILNSRLNLKIDQLGVRLKQVEVRNIRMADYQELKDAMIEAYSSWPGIFWGGIHQQASGDFPRRSIWNRGRWQSSGLCTGHHS